MEMVMSNVPRLRFKADDGSEFREWEKLRIGDIYNDLKTGSTPSRAKPEYFRGENLWITSGELNYKRVSDTAERITDEAVKDTGLRLYPAGTFFIAITGLEAPGTRGKCGINALPATTNQSCLAFYEKTNVNTSFLYNWYRRFSESLYFKYAQGTKQQSYNNKIVENFVISLPSKAEQQKIAAFLTAVDTKIEQLSQKEALLKQYKKGVMQKIFSQEIRFKADDGSEFSEWQEKKLGEIASFFKGKGISKADISDDGSLPCIRYGELYTDYSETIAAIKSKTHIDPAELLLSKGGEVIIPASGETRIDIARAACVLSEGVALGGDLNVLTTDQDGVFLSYYLNNASKYEIANLAQGVSVMHLYSSQLKLLSLELPCLAEQKKISAFLTALDQQIDLVKIEQKHAKTFKKGLLQQMFV